MKNLLNITAALLFLTAALGIAPAHSQAKEATAVFAGGCFWCMESDFEKHKGVREAVSGYAGGHVDNPTYKQVSKGDTGHYEVVQVIYDPKVISYKELLEIYWANIDPLDDKGQFCDKGDSYKTAIFYSSDEQRDRAQKAKNQISNKLKQDLATVILPLKTFYPAEDYHQDYYKKNPQRYSFYRWRCGRDSRLEELWGKKAGKAISLPPF